MYSYEYGTIYPLEKKVEFPPIATTEQLNRIRERYHGIKSLILPIGKRLRSRTPIKNIPSLDKTVFNLMGDLITKQTRSIKLELDDFRSQLADEYAAYLATFLGVHLSEESLELIRYLEPPQLQERVFRALLSLLEKMASLQPLVLVLDDLHWIDPTSLDLLKFLLPITDRQSILIMVAFRPRRSEPS